MTSSYPSPPSKVELLPRDVTSLSRWVPRAAPDTLFVLGLNGGMSVAPDANFPLVFGRNEPEVHVCVGADDTRVSRRHGVITREYSRWVLKNTGSLPIRLPGQRLLLNGHWAELPTGYTPLFIVAPAREHLLEVRVATHASRPLARHGALTDPGEPPFLDDNERLVLVCLSQRYLRQDPQAQPLAWKQVAAELKELRPTQRWTWRRAAHIVAKVRARLSPTVSGLREEEVPPPVGNALNVNLITYLMTTTALTPTDLHLLDG